MRKLKKRKKAPIFVIILIREKGYVGELLVTIRSFRLGVVINVIQLLQKNIRIN